MTVQKRFNINQAVVGAEDKDMIMTNDQEQLLDMKTELGDKDDTNYRTVTQSYKRN